MCSWWIQWGKSCAIWTSTMCSCPLVRSFFFCFERDWSDLINDYLNIIEIINIVHQLTCQSFKKSKAQLHSFFLPISCSVYFALFDFNYSNKQVVLLPLSIPLPNCASHGFPPDHSRSPVAFPTKANKPCPFVLGFSDGGPEDTMQDVPGLHWQHRRRERAGKPHRHAAHGSSQGVQNTSQALWWNPRPYLEEVADSLQVREAWPVHPRRPSGWAINSRINLWWKELVRAAVWYPWYPCQSFKSSKAKLDHLFALRC